jgi:GDP/UDP-N,N'-diacetylbacillosamine 2-epimerase (hydrolysing)
LREILAREDRPEKPSGRALVVFHACGRPPATEARATRAVLQAVASAGLRRLIVYPNTDRGHRGVIQAIEQHRRASPPDDVRVWRSLPRDDYLRTLIGVDVLVGNSSSGIIESPLAGTPSVDVGRRQGGREQGGTSVLHVDESYGAIRRGVLAALRKRPRPGRPTVYGDGRAGERIARVLARVPLTSDFARKVITY